MVDLGLSGSDFSELKARYGSVSVDNCPAAADCASLLYSRPDAAKTVPTLKQEILVNDAKIPARQHNEEMYKKVSTNSVQQSDATSR